MPNVEHDSRFHVHCWECRKEIESWNQIVEWDGMSLCLACAYITAVENGIVKPCITDSGRPI